MCYRYQLTTLGGHQRTARRVASHPVVIVLCTKLDAECDRQATVVGRLLTTLGDDRPAVRGWRKAPEGITLMFGDIRISYLFDKYSPASGALFPRPEAFDPVEARPGLHALARSPTHATMV